MRILPLLAFALLLPAAVRAQDAQNAGAPEDAPVPHIVVEKPIPPDVAQTVPVPRRPQTPAQAEADKALKDQASADVDARAEEVSEACGSTIKARIDWTTIDPAEINRNSPGDACGAALEAVGQACASDTARPMIAEEVRQIVCTAGPQPAIDLHGGTMVYAMDWQSRNPAAAIYEYLMRNL